jgi:methionyl-tRNA formyltransferase
MLSIKPSIGILNLHTGLSPYVKGGPNSTNWCIANNELYLIGNTIMWIDEGIDPGNIVTTEITEFTGDERLTDVHIKVMDHGHNLYLKAIDNLAQGRPSSVDQKTIVKAKHIKPNSGD